jgi:alanine dehydrogenase
MKIGVPKEIKIHEYRVGLTPAGVRELRSNGHDVVIETNAGAGVGFDDASYVEAGATIAPPLLRVRRCGHGGQSQGAATR